MVMKFLFWMSFLLVFAGTRSSEGNLFFFFAVLLMMAAIGRFLHQRAKRVSVASVRASVPGPAGKADKKGKTG